MGARASVAAGRSRIWDECVCLCKGVIGTLNSSPRAVLSGSVRGRQYPSHYVCACVCGLKNRESTGDLFIYARLSDFTADAYICIIKRKTVQKERTIGN